MEFLSRQYDQLQMHSRRKIILLHGVAEESKENVIAKTTQVLSENLGMPQFDRDSVKHCHRLGRPGTDKPRAILVKFKDGSAKEKVWSGNKGTGITMSEFLTKPRHKTFLAARQRFGVSKCWTRDGNIIVLGPDGARHRITNMSELNAIPSLVSDASVPVMSSNTSSVVPQLSKGINQRAKRVIKK